MWNKWWKWYKWHKFRNQCKGRLFASQYCRWARRFRQKRRTGLFACNDILHRFFVIKNLLIIAKEDKENVYIIFDNSWLELDDLLIEVLCEIKKNGNKVQIIVVDKQEKLRQNVFIHKLMQAGLFLFYLPNYKGPHFILVGEKAFLCLKDKNDSTAIIAFNDKQGALIKKQFDIAWRDIDIDWEATIDNLVSLSKRGDYWY